MYQDDLQDVQRMFYLISVGSVSMDATNSQNKTQPTCEYFVAFIPTSPGTADQKELGNLLKYGPVPQNMEMYLKHG